MKSLVQEETFFRKKPD